MADAPDASKPKVGVPEVVTEAAPAQNGKNESILRHQAASTSKPKLVTIPWAGKVQRRRRDGAKPYKEGIVPVERGTESNPIDGADQLDIVNPPDPGNSNITVSFHGGALIPNVRVELLFWGTAWTQPTTTPTAAQVVRAVQNILAGPYMSGIRQYAVGFGTLRGTIIALSDPPNPFSSDDWHNLIWDLIDQGTFPEPDDAGGRNLYLFITPPGTGYNQPGVGGAHGDPGDYDFPADYDRAWAGFVLNDGNIDTITTTLSHELVEACTDPEGDGWTIDGRSPPTDEIGDVCQGTVSRVNGIAVQGYWSRFDGACLIPTVFSLRRFLLMTSRNLSQGLRNIQPPVTSVRTLLHS